MINKIQSSDYLQVNNSISFKGNTKITKQVLKKSQVSGILVTAAVGLAALTKFGKKKIYADLDINEVKADLEAGYSINKLAKKYEISNSSMRNFLKENNLATKEGAILKNIKKEDLIIYLLEGKSAKEIAQIYGLNNPGALSPLFKIFELEPATEKKVSDITKEELLGYKICGISDKELSNRFNVSPAYIASRRNALGISSMIDLKEYPVDEIGYLIETQGLIPEEVSQKLNISLNKILQIVHEKGFVVKPRKPLQVFKYKKNELINFVSQLDENEFKNKELWLYAQKSSSRSMLKLTMENIDLSKFILENKALRDALPDLELILSRIAKKSRKEPSVYKDTVDFLTMITNDDKLNVLKDPANNLEVILSQRHLSSKDVLKIYNKLISDDDLIEAVKLGKGGFTRLVVKYEDPSALINKIKTYNSAIKEMPLNFKIIPNKNGKRILEDLAKG